MRIFQKNGYCQVKEKCLKMHIKQQNVKLSLLFLENLTTTNRYHWLQKVLPLGSAMNFSPYKARM